MGVMGMMPAPPGGGDQEEELRILMIEDSPEDLELIQRELRRAKFRLISRQAASADQIRHQLADFTPDLVVSDFAMPGFDGMSALRIIREAVPDVPFIFVSGTIGEERATEALKQGATDYVLKSHLKRLSSVVRRALDEVSHRRERLRVEEALRTSEERYRLVALATNDIIWDWDLRAGRMDLGEAIATRLGYHAGRLVDRAWWTDRIHPDDAERVERSLAEALTGPTSLWTQEYRFRRGDEHYAYLVDRGFILRAEGGRPVRMIGAALDLTERKRLEEQLLHAQKMDAVGQLAGGLAHDFNNLLSVILAHADLALEDLGAVSPSAQDLKEIQGACRRAASLTRQLLAFSRRQLVEPRTFDLNGLIRDMERMIRRTLPENVVLQVVPADLPLVVKADPGQIEQVLLNLAVNARDAMPTGGSLAIEVRQELRDRPFGRSRVPAGRWQVIAVHDTGHGMTPEIRQHLFEPFFSTKPAGRGTGLGLATCAGIVRGAGGYIEVESAPDAGALFEVLLPAVDQTPEVVWEVAAPAALIGGKEGVLVVEDEPSLRSAEAETLSRLGYRVQTAANGEQALRLLEIESNHFDLVITDLVLPDMRGTVLATQALERWPTLRVLYLSGYAEVEMSGVTGLEGAFLAKPFTRAIFAKKVRGILDR